MFKNPGKKLSVFVKVMFWVLSVFYILFACGFALINTIIMAALDAVMANASNSISSIMGNGNSYSSGGAVFLSVSGWAMALLSIIPVVLMLYWVSLFLLTVAEMNIELKETKETVQHIEDNLQGYDSSKDYYTPQPNLQSEYSAPMQQQMPLYTQPKPYYKVSEPSYVPPTPVYNPPISYNSPQTQDIPKPTVVETQKQETPALNVQTPPQEPEPVSETKIETQETQISPEPQATESKEDILSKYGSSGNYYRKQ